MLDTIIAGYRVDVWEERNRLSVVLYDSADRPVAEWWDDDARAMFTDGFFERGRRLTYSVLSYATSMGLL